MERREGEGGEVVVAGGQAEEVASGREMERLVVRHVIAGTLGASSRNRDSTTAGGGGGEEQVIRCERFLPRRSLRVLLVESDDSTRHIIAALLRKCSYKVAAVADGLKAWEFLKEKHYNFDLVLTEVVMPSLSGIGLLSKIMNNEICKSIPVIMMSSHDSIGIVFKCMQEGASDFLVKPVRKNELRNLWQHVWRKYSSNSSGNWYGGGTPNQVRFEAVSDNDAASNHRNANAGNKSKTGNRSDKESDTQSSCSKPETENEIVRKPGESLETENRSFLKETNSILEKHEYNMVTASSMHERGKSEDKSTRLEIKVSKTASNKEVWEKNGIYSGSLCRGEWSTSMRNKEGAANNPESLDQTEGTKEPPREIINFIGVETSKQCSSPSPVLGNNDNGKVVLCQPAKSFDARSRMCTSGPFPLRELSLEHVKHQNGGVFQEKHVLNHSDASPFSRYAGSRIHVSSSRSGSSSASLCIRTDGSSSVKSHINSSSNDGKSICYYISSSSRNEDGEPSSSVTLREDACVGHSFTENIVFPYPQLGFIPLPVPVGAMPFQNLCAGYNTILQPTFYQETSTLLCESSEMGRQDALHPPNQCVHDNHFTNDFNSDTCHHCVENPHPHRLTHSIKESGDNSKPTYPRTMFPKPTEMADQLGICNHGITDASGSNGSDEDASAAANTGISVESGNEDGFRNCKGKVLERDCSRREAALIRFRLKRKDRCFEKKVRYHSRQKLAEQRPRLKGQFIRQSVAESTAITAEAES